jgi:hypothetical protein
MTSREFTSMLGSRLAIPSALADERMSDVKANTAKRPLVTSSDFVSTLTAAVQAKRRFVGDLPPFMRMPNQGSLVDGMRVVNTGFSTEDAQTDETVSQPVFAQPFPDGWEQEYVEQTPLFCSSYQPGMAEMQIFSIASPAVVNFGLELKSQMRARALLAPDADAADALDEVMWSLQHLTADDADDFAAKWKLLGPMTSMLSTSITTSRSSSEVARATTNARLLTYACSNRGRYFNMFDPHVRKGAYLFFCARDYDMSHNRTFVDVHGHAVAARREFPAFELQVMGASETFTHAPSHNSSYNAVSAHDDAFTDPTRADTDYMARAVKLAKDYRPLELDEFDRPTFRAYGADSSVQSRIEEAPELVYRAYMEGRCQKVGYARSTDGAAPTEAAVRDAHRSHHVMKQLQTLSVYII